MFVGYVCHKFMALSGTNASLLSSQSYLSLRDQTLHVSLNWSDVSSPVWSDLFLKKTENLTKNSPCKESINSFLPPCLVHSSCSAPRPFACVLPCEVVTDESGLESVMRVHCAEDNDCTRWAPRVFSCTYVFNTTHIGVYTAGVEWKCQCGHVRRLWGKVKAVALGTLVDSLHVVYISLSGAGVAVWRQR